MTEQETMKSLLHDLDYMATPENYKAVTDILRSVIAETSNYAEAMTLLNQRLGAYCRS